MPETRKTALDHQVLTTAAQLKEVFSLNGEELRKMEGILDQFPMRVTPYYLSLIDPQAGESDPIRRMCIPSLKETDLSGSFDTSGEGSNTMLRGLQHKYRQTALILSTNRCAMYCRHCFRKRLVGLEADSEVCNDIVSAAVYVARHTEINNVLISGGDAFMNDNETIREYLDLFTAIDTLDYIRFGTRLPVVLPQRIYEGQVLLDMLASYGKKKQIYVVTQFNHPREITPESRQALKALRETGAILRNQTVLLHGVNDDPEVLSDLLRKLSGAGVVPYYIFQCRPVAAVKNQFQVPLLKGIDVVQEALNHQSGQAKCVRFCMSHPRGKIEILGKVSGHSLLMKYHQAKYAEDAGKIFTVDLADGDCWLPEEIPGKILND